MKILTVVGARPQFVKAAAVSRKLREKHEEILVHTGQHYDKNMSDIFFEELSIPEADYNLGVGSGSHACQTANMLIGLEEVMQKESPDLVLLYGDTNSTMAGALAAAKLLIPIAHIEAGLRSFNKKMPEEQNRIVTDHLSSMLFCPTETAVNNLYAEGIQDKVYNVGDVMCDAVLYYTKGMDYNDKEKHIKNIKFLFGNKNFDWDSWYLTTIHRAENTDSIEKISNILSALNQLDHMVIFPVHPRIRGMVKQLNEEREYPNLCFIEPLGYTNMLFFLKYAVKAVTDSGGLQKEAYILKTNAVTIREQTEWVETVKSGHNILAHPEEGDLLNKINRENISFEQNADSCYGNGDAAEKIISLLSI